MIVGGESYNISKQDDMEWVSKTHRKKKYKYIEKR